MLLGRRALLLLLLLQLRKRIVDPDGEPGPTGLLLGPMGARRRVLFVCVENAGRSLMAEAIFNADPPAGWTAASAGTRPAASPNPRVLEALHEAGLRPPGHPPQPLTPTAVDEADLVVTMGCLDDASCPARLKQRPMRDWGLPDPKGMDAAGVRGVRDEIARRISALRTELATARGPLGAR